MKLTIAICTWNRSDLLDQTLAEMSKLEMPLGVEWELMVVNNNCTDNTDEIVAKHSSTLPIRLLHETKPGLSNARNCAVSAAAGEYILWTDDDVLVGSRWLAAYVAAFAHWPDAAFFGGPILPWFESPTPAWLQEIFPQISSAYAALDLGDVPIVCDKNKLCPFGANFAVRMDVQRRHLYDPQYGYTGNSKIVGDESMMLYGIIAEGLTGRWIPEAKVRHFIPRDRQTTTYLRRYFYGQGLTASVQKRGAGVRIGFSEKCIDVARVIRSEVKSRVAWFFGRRKCWIRYLVDANEARGRLFG